MIRRVREIIGRRGLRGTLLALGRLFPWTRWHDEFHFYELDLTDAGRPRRSFDGDLALRQGAAADVALLAQLPHDPEVTTMTPELAQERMDKGAMFWLVTEGGKVAFCCWNFLGAGPLTGAQGADRPIPAQDVLLEDSISSPDFRGRGVAPAAWSGIADFHAAAGRRAMITKIAASNEAVRRALVKAGFRDVAHMRRSGPAYRMRIAITAPEGGPTAHWLSALDTGS
jgi:RimJ/RimL family protein N-acetyltransferase